MSAVGYNLSFLSLSRVVCVDDEALIERMLRWRNILALILVSGDSFGLLTQSLL